jgi:hypothetical protein
VHLERRPPVLEVVLLAEHGAGELAGLAHGEHAGPGEGRRRARDEESARLYPADLVEAASERVGQTCGERMQGGRAREHRREVAERHTRFGEVWNGRDAARDELAC